MATPASKVYSDTLPSNMNAVEITLRRSDKEGLGFNIRGGYDMPHIPGDSGIFVTKIREDGAAASDGRLLEGDKIIKVNGHSLENLDHRTAVQLFKRAGAEVTLLVIPGAERSIRDSTSKKVNPKPVQFPVNATLLAGLGATLLFSFAIYKFRGSIKSFIVSLGRSNPTNVQRLVYQPYTPKY